jgi:hypothetical protein
VPEVTFGGRAEQRSSQYALYAAASVRGGLQPDLLSDTGWWQSPLWTYALYAVVICTRAAAERPDVPASGVAQLCAARRDIDLDPTGDPATVASKSCPTRPP